MPLASAILFSRFLPPRSEILFPTPLLADEAFSFFQLRIFPPSYWGFFLGKRPLRKTFSRESSEFKRVFFSSIILHLQKRDVYKCSFVSRNGSRPVAVERGFSCKSFSLFYENALSLLVAFPVVPRTMPPRSSEE